jgi:hypothetical protein
VRNHANVVAAGRAQNGHGCRPKSFLEDKQGFDTTYSDHISTGNYFNMRRVILCRALDVYWSIELEHLIQVPKKAILVSVN